MNTVINQSITSQMKTLAGSPSLIASRAKELLSKVPSLSQVPEDWQDILHSVRNDNVSICQQDKDKIFERQTKLGLLADPYSNPDLTPAAVRMIREDFHAHGNPWNFSARIFKSPAVASMNAAAASEDGKHQAEFQKRLIQQRKADEAKLTDVFDSALSSFILRSAIGGSEIPFSIKDEVLAADYLRLRVTEGILAGGFDLDEARELFDDPKSAPLFLGHAQLSEFGESVAKQLDINPGSPEFDEFVIRQSVALIHRHFYFT